MTQQLFTMTAKFPGGKIVLTGMLPPKAKDWSPARIRSVMYMNADKLSCDSLASLEMHRRQIDEATEFSIVTGAVTI